MWKSFLFRFKKCLAVNMKKEGKHIRSALFRLLSYPREWKCSKLSYFDKFEDRDPKSPSFGQPTIFEIFIWLYCFDIISTRLIKIQRFGEIKSIFAPLFFFTLRACSSFTLLSFCGWHPRVLWLKEISTPTLVWSQDSIWGGHIGFNSINAPFISYWRYTNIFCILCEVVLWKSVPVSGNLSYITELATVFNFSESVIKSSNHAILKRNIEWNL